MTAAEKYYNAQQRRRRLFNDAGLCRYRSCGEPLATGHGTLCEQHRREGLEYARTRRRPDARPVRCVRCREVGHFAKTCTS